MIPIDVRKLLKKAILVDVKPAYAYADGVRQNTITGYKYTVARPEFGYEKINVRIDGEQLMDVSDDYISVVFDNPDVHMYYHGNGYDITASATSVHSANTKASA